MKQFLIALSFLTLSAVAFADCGDMFFNKVQPVTKEPSVTLCHNRFAIGYSKSKHAPLWVASYLTRTQIQSAGVIRKNRFRPDPLVNINEQSTVNEFIGTQFDKGHMISFDDLSDDFEAADESFFMTNITAQLSANNRGIWKVFEIYTRNLILSRGDGFVISGPIFNMTPKRLANGTSIPVKFYKVVLIPSTHEAFIMVVPNEKILSADAPKYFTSFAALLKANPTVDVTPFKSAFNVRGMIK